jgi:hypothetical protein
MIAWVHIIARGRLWSHRTLNIEPGVLTDRHILPNANTSTAPFLRLSRAVMGFTSSISGAVHAPMPRGVCVVVSFAVVSSPTMTVPKSVSMARPMSLMRTFSYGRVSKSCYVMSCRHTKGVKARFIVMSACNHGCLPSVDHRGRSSHHGNISAHSQCHVAD